MQNNFREYDMQYRPSSNYIVKTLNGSKVVARHIHTSYHPEMRLRIRKTLISSVVMSLCYSDGVLKRPIN